VKLILVLGLVIINSCSSNIKSNKNVSDNKHALEKSFTISLTKDGTIFYLSNPIALEDLISTLVKDGATKKSWFWFRYRDPMVIGKIERAVHSELQKAGFYLVVAGSEGTIQIVDY